MADALHFHPTVQRALRAIRYEHRINDSGGMLPLARDEARRDAKVGSGGRVGRFKTVEIDASADGN